MISSSSSTHHVAIRRHGVCRGSLWRQQVENGSGGGSSSHHAAAPSSSWGEVEYCTVTANWLICHESVAAYERGDAPLCIYRVVGASAWRQGGAAAAAAPGGAAGSSSAAAAASTASSGNVFQLMTNQGTQLFCQAVTQKCRDHWLATLQTGLELTLLHDDDNENKAQNDATRYTTSNLTPPSPQVHTTKGGGGSGGGNAATMMMSGGGNNSASNLFRRGSGRLGKKYCLGCGALEHYVNKPLSATAPLWQYGKEGRMDLCRECATAQGLLDHLQFVKACMATAQQEQTALLQARELCVNLVTPKLASPQASPKRRVAESNDPGGSVAVVAQAGADATNGAEESSPPSPSSSPPQQPQQEENSMEPQSPPPACPPPPPPPPPPEGESSDDRNSDGSNESWTAVDTPEDDAAPASAPTSASSSSSSSAAPATTASTPTRESATTTTPPKQPVAVPAQPPPSSWIHISPTSKSTAALFKALRDDSTRVGGWKQVSPFLESLVDDLLEGRIGVADFLEQLDEAVGLGDNEETVVALKKQAFQVAGDMGTAMKLLLDHALPKGATAAAGGTGSSLSSSSGSMGGISSLLLDAASSRHSTQTLQCLLEFFLDLCHGGELSSVAFFWPQLCHLHLCMLPADNAAAVARVDLVEDFLLTVSTRYSVHLALELIWSHTADLEESILLSATESSPASRARRFSVLRFVCELESHLFGYEDGWGGGSVTLGKLLSATGDQLTLMKRTIAQIQRLRRQRPMALHRSVRHRQEDQEEADDEERPPEELVQEKLRIAKNADYFTSHLNFTKRICDVAEKLRFMDVRQRAKALEDELNLLNSSGAMGGDPLNRIRSFNNNDRDNDNGPGSGTDTGEGGESTAGNKKPRDPTSLVRIARVPPTEGHVFRSKERTPVLLLVEQIDEGAERYDSSSEFSLGNSPASKWNGAMAQARLATQGMEDTSVTDNVTDTEDLSSYQEASDGTASVGDMSQTDLEAQTPPRPPNSSGAFSVNSTSMDHSSNSRHSIASGSGELEGEPRDHRQHTHALKRFDGGASSSGDDPPATPKEEVDKLVTSVMVERFSVELPGLEHMGVRQSDGALAAESAQPREEQPLEPRFSNVTARTAETKTTTTTLPTGQSTTEGGTRRSETDGSKEGDGSDSRDEERNKEVSFGEIAASSSTSPRSAAAAAGPRRMFKNSGCDNTGDQPNDLAPTGDIRREVLNVIMMAAQKERNSIAAGTAESVQRSLKELETKRAMALLVGDKASEGGKSPSAPTLSSSDQNKVEDLRSTTESLAALGLSATSQLEVVPEQPSEEDEVMEAVRLLLIQNRVAQGHLSAADAAKVLQHVSLSRVSLELSLDLKSGAPVLPNDMPTVDAGDLDPRLVGCGPLPPAVLQALTLWKGEMVSNGELLELVKKDIEFVRHSVLLEAESLDKRKEDSAFWGRFAFGERWAEKKARIAATSPQGSHPGWDLVGIIVKSNDDLRQEAFVMQLIELCQEAFEIAGLELWVSPYRILATGRTTGIIEMVRNAMSFDALKKRPGYGKGGLREHLHRMTEFTADPGGSFKAAQQNFVRSLAAYSLMSYFFLFKDRHNGNLLLDTAGHVIHIDFGFVFGVAPGGSFSLEMSTPFKLTEEMLEVMGGLNSPLFSDFVTLFCCGFLALQSYSDTFLTLVEITSRNSTFKCFDGQNREEILTRLSERFCPELNKEETIAFALDLIKQATTSYGTRQYDLFQYLSQGIAA